MYGISSLGVIQGGFFPGMSQRDRGGFFKAVTASFTVVLAILIAVLIWSLAVSHTEYRQAAEQQAHKYAERADDRITRTCINLAPTDYAECVRQIIDTAQEYQTAEYDLAAQQSMALWAAAMFWATVGTVVVASIGIYYVRDTLLETRRIGQAQVRAYLADDGFNVEWGATDDGRATVTNIETIWKNFGQSPAFSCGGQILVHGVELKDIGEPIPESTRALVNLGAVSVSAGSRMLCGGVSLSADEVADWLGCKNALVIHSMVSYRDVFGSVHRTETCHQLVHIEKPGGNKVRFRVYPHHNSAT